VGAILLPLAGVTVVSLEQAVAAPFATRQLADLGARVVKVERPDGGDFARRYDEAVAGESSYFVWLNRSKESVAVDVKAADGRRILQELVDRADVVVQNLGPGAARRLDIAADQVRVNDEAKIVLAITGWGSTGPWAGRKAYDLLVQFEAGLPALTGSDTEPARVGISVADIAAGMYGFSGVLAALYQRSVTGIGASLEVSLFEALAEWMSQPANYAAGAGVAPPRSGAHHATIAPYGPYLTRDRKTLIVAVQNEPEWHRFCAVVLADPSLAHDHRFQRNSLRVANRAALNAIVADRFRALDAVTAAGLLDEAAIGRATASSVADFVQHPVLAQRDRWRPVQTPAGRAVALLPPIDGWNGEARMDPVPALGAHTSAVLHELGRSRAEITDLADRGVVQLADDHAGTSFS